MPRKKKVTRKKTTHTRNYRKAKIEERFHGIRWLESYSSFLLGVVVVIVAVLFGVSLVRQQNKSHIQQTSSLSTGPVTPTKIFPSPTPGTTVVENNNTYYVVKSDDSLWSIAMSVYNDGYKWTDIAKANNLANPGIIFTGDKLLLPNAPQPSQLGKLLSPSLSPMPTALTGKTYTVQPNDTLWNIAVRAYADGYQWVKIAKANNLSNPDLIFSGNVLQIPR